MQGDGRKRIKVMRSWGRRALDCLGRRQRVERWYETVCRHEPEQRKGDQTC